MCFSMGIVVRFWRLTLVMVKHNSILRYDSQQKGEPMREYLFHNLNSRLALSLVMRDTSSGATP